MWSCDATHRHLLRRRRRQWLPVLHVIMSLLGDNKPWSVMDVGSGAIEPANWVSVDCFYWHLSKQSN